jgi:hypothetical protein
LNFRSIEIKKINLNYLNKRKVRVLPLKTNSVLDLIPGYLSKQYDNILPL